MMIHGWAGTDLEIDLSQGKIERKEGDHTLYEAYLGGKGTDLKILWDRVPPEVDPFSPDNLLIVGAGVLDGTIIPGANRTNITFKSPLTGLLGHSCLGGDFGPELKFAGYDTIVISGKSPTPVYLWIHDDTVEMRDAGHLWGKNTMETQTILRKELNEKAQILCIGPAGEHKVYFASIEHGMGVSASRRGAGCVMGDKNLKAIAVYGTKDISIANPSKLNTLCEQILSKTGHRLKHWEKHPVPIFMGHPFGGAYGNFKETMPPNVEESLKNIKKLGEEYRDSKTRRLGCYNCIVHCREVYRLADGTYSGIKCSMPARPMISCQIFEIGFNNEFNSMCQKYGFDNISLQSSIAFAIDLYERGILTKEDTGGMHLEWQNAQVAFWLIEKIAYREGIGALLADGIYRAARQIGKGSEKFAITQKKLESRHEYGGFQAREALADAVSDDQDAHKNMDIFIFSRELSQEQRAEYVETLDFEAYPKELKENYIAPPDSAGSNYEEMCLGLSFTDESHSLIDSLGLCVWWTDWFAFPPIPHAMFADLVSYSTGLDIDNAELRKIAKRIITLARSYNVREGLKREDDTVPEFYFHYKPVEHYAKRGCKTLDRNLFNKWIDTWYKLKGWDSDGVPTKATLEELGLDYVYEDLERRRISARPTSV